MRKLPVKNRTQAAIWATRQPLNSAERKDLERHGSSDDIPAFLKSLGRIARTSTIWTTGAKCGSSSLRREK
jgi:hypothetical protein